MKKVCYNIYMILPNRAKRRVTRCETIVLVAAEQGAPAAFGCAAAVIILIYRKEWGYGKRFRYRCCRNDGYRCH